MKEIKHKIFDIAAKYETKYKKTRSIYALVDGRSDPSIAQFLTDNFEDRVCLINEASDVLGYDKKSPWIVKLSKENKPALDAFMNFNWQGHSGMFILSEDSLEDLSKHLAQFILVKNYVNQKVLFRFHDPRVFIEFMDCCTPEHKNEILGENNIFIMEDEEQDQAMVTFESGSAILPDQNEESDLPNSDPDKKEEFKLNKEEVGYMNQCYRKSSHKEWIEAYKKQDIEATTDQATGGLLLKDQMGSVAKLYDDGNTIVTESPEGREFKYRIDNNRSIDKVTDPAGTEIKFDYDERDYLMAVRNGEQKTLFEYGHRSHLNSITFPDKTGHKYTYTPLSRLHTSTDRNGNTTEYKYKGNGTLKRKTDPLGNVTEFVTDEINNPLSLVFPDASKYDINYGENNLIEKILINDTPYADFDVNEDENTINVSYHDESFVNLKTEDNKRILEAENEFTKVSFEYDDEGRLLKELSDDATVTYERDVLGNITCISASNGVQIDIERDKDHRITELTDAKGNVHKVSYALNGALESITYPNGVTTSIETNRNGYPVSVDTKGSKESYYKAEHTYDLCDRLIGTVTASEEKTFSYDPEGRITQVESTIEKHNEFFKLDANGNILEDKIGKNTYTNADKLKKSGAYEFAYDEHGRITHDRKHAYKYNGRGQVIKIINLDDPQEKIEYKYDALGRRIRKYLEKSYTIYIWAGETLLSEKTIDRYLPSKVYDKTNYLFFPSTPLPVSMIKNDKSYLFHTGQRNEVLFITDEKAEIKWQAEYSAFGKADISIEDIVNPFRLAGQYFDTETGMHYNLARYYNPNIGRFYTRDPLFVDGGSGNFYIYCNGDPLNRMDPTGEFLLCAILIGAAIGAGLEMYKQNKAIKAGEQEGYNLWGIAKAGAIGGVIGAIGAGVGAAVTGVAAAKTVAGFAAVGFVEGVASTFAEQCAENAMTGSNVGLGETLKDAMVAGTIGAVLGAATAGIGGMYANRARKLASSTGDAVADAKNVKKLKKIEEEVCQNMPASNQKLNVCLKDPINAITGEVIEDAVDFTFSSKLELNWTRHYGTHSKYQGHSGYKWQTPADSRIEIKENGYVHFYDGGDGCTVFESLPEEDNPVKEISDGAVISLYMNRYLVKLKSGITYSFVMRDITSKVHYIDRIFDTDYNWVEFVRNKGNLTKIKSDKDSVLHVTSEAGKIKEIHYTAADSDVQHHLVSYDYDDEGNLTHVYDALNNPFTYEYKNNLLVKHTDRNGNSYYHEYDSYNDTGKCTYAYGDDNIFEIKFKYEEDRTEFTDSLGIKKTIVYDENNLATEEIDHIGNKTICTYDETGRCTSLTDGQNRTTYYKYDDDGNNTVIVRPDGEKITMAYENNLPVSIEDPNKNTWLQKWNDKGKLSSQTSPGGGETQYRYNKEGDLSSTLDAAGNETLFETSTLGIIESITNEKKHKSTFTHDDFGNITEATDAEGNTTTYVYDKKSRLTQVEKPSGACVFCKYDGQDNLISYQDENGHTTRFQYTFTDRIAKKINPDKTEVIYTYDTEDQLVSVKNERGETYSFKRDYSGRVTEETDYFGKTTKYGYNTHGTLYNKIDPLNRITEFAFDKLGRLTEKQFYKTDTDFTPYKTESFEYDANGNITAHDNDDRQITRIINSENQVVTETQGKDIYIYNEYDIMGRRTKRQTSLGNIVEYEYDELGNTSAITINGEKTTTIERDKTGLPLRETFAGPLTREYKYNKDGRLTKQNIGTVSRSIVERNYVYDKTGNLLEKDDSAKGKSYFSYDPMGRISQYINPENKVEEFLRDPAGDLIKQHDSTLESESKPESYTRTSVHKDSTYTFDAVGNLIKRHNRSKEDLTTFTWDECNRLVRAIRNGTVTEMHYDAAGRRISKETNGEKTEFFWDGEQFFADKKDGKIREFIYYPGTFEPLAVVDENRKTFYFNNDLVGLPQEVITDTGEIVWSASYDANGKVTKIHEDFFDNPLRLQGQYMDPEIDLCYNRYRYYDPDTGSFISADPLGLGAGTNNYSYADNVWSFIDPMGLMGCKLPEYDNWSDFRKDFSSMKRYQARAAWDQYKKDPNKFFGRKKVQDILKAKKKIPYTPTEKAQLAINKANSGYVWTHGDTIPAKGVQFTVEFFKGIFTPQGTPQIYDTPAGNLGATIGTAIGNF